MVVVLFLWVLLVSLVLRGCLSSSPVPVSPPVLSVVGNTLVLGKSFQVLCSSDRGSLPITYTLRRADVKADMTRVVSTPGEQAIFNCSPILERSTLKNFICHANNSRNRAPEVANGIHRLNSTTIIGEMRKQ